MKPFENLTELLAWLSRAYPERCSLLPNEAPNTYLLSWSDDEDLVAPVNGEWLKHDEPLVEYLLREIIEAEDMYICLCTLPRDGFGSGFTYEATVSNCEVEASSMVLALGSALREAKSA